MGDVTAEIAVDPAGHVPPFEQVRAQIADLIATGELLPGDRLPTVRALAADLGLASNTVARAYKALETGGLVEAHSRAGTRVASGQHTAEVVLASLAAKFGVGGARGRPHRGSGGRSRPHGSAIAVDPVRLSPNAAGGRGGMPSGCVRRDVRAAGSQGRGLGATRGHGAVQRVEQPSEPRGS